MFVVGVGDCGGVNNWIFNLIIIFKIYLFVKVNLLDYYYYYRHRCQRLQATK